MIKTIIVDDDKSCINTLEKLLSKYCPQVLILGTANTIPEAVDLIERKNPELVFLDVELNGELGFDLLKRPEAINLNVIFTTAHEKYALRAIKSSCLEYLLKPIDHNELKAAIGKLEGQLHLESNKNKIEVLLSNMGAKDNSFNKIIIPGHDSHIFLNTNEIVCCEADMNYTNVYTEKGEKIVSTKSLKEFEETLDPRIFFRSHKSWLINLNFIKKFLKSDSQVLMSNDMLIDISVRKREEFLNLFKKL
ncbi:MAG: response regulator transcription factor [Bacteroidetes bacterium]|jgi:two-component system LytT family response regulator|nr:response regulator transcription factor [Bacteroidota bacterium]